MITTLDPARQVLRHAVATIAYRMGKVLRGTPVAFGDFRAGDGIRTPREILAHVGDLFDWGLALANGQKTWRASTPLTWDDEQARFSATLAAFDARLAADAALQTAPERLLQGPIADALTHTGQVALLRRMAGIPVRGENYFVATIEAGRVGPDQAAPRREFD